jgi:hypothetical protein
MPMMAARATIHANGKLMREKRRKIRRRASLIEWLSAVALGLAAVVLGIAAYNHGIPIKWVTAVMATLLPFSMVIYSYRRRPLRWDFWTAMAICLLLHSIGMWVIFQYVFSGLQRFSILFWYPIMFFEMIALLLAIKRIQTMLTGKKEIKG